MKAEPHLRDLFRVGEEAKINVPMPDGTPGTVTIWMRAPSPELQQQAIRHAGGKSARVKSRFRDKEGDDYIALWSQVEDLEERSDIETFMISTEDSTIRDQAYNEILYGEEWGSNWTAEPIKTGPKSEMEPLDYLNVVTALLQRKQELREEDLPLEEDEEHTRLLALFEAFQKEVEDRAEALRDAKRASLHLQSDAELRNEVMKRLIDLEQRQAWLLEYNLWMLHFSCRNFQDRKKYYFKDPYEVEELPTSVRSQLNEAFREVNRAGNDLKVSDSPDLFLVSSELSGESVEVSSLSSQKES